MEKTIIPGSKNFSVVIHVLNPFIATLITYFFIFLLQDLLLIAFIFADIGTSVFLFILLLVLMVITSYIIPQNNPTPEMDLE